jgi:hypothetical protein
MVNVAAVGLAFVDAAQVGGAAAWQHHQIQYNGLAIQVQLPPKAFDIESKVINGIALIRRLARNPPLPQANVILESNPVSVVSADELQPPTEPNNLQALLQNGEWGQAFIGLVQGVRTPVQITENSIKSIFEWDETVTRIQACRNSYAQAIVDLLQLPSGVGLIRDIIIAHHCMPKLPKLKFIKSGDDDDDDGDSGIEHFEYPESSEINLEWDDGNSRHVGSDRILVVRNSNLNERLIPVLSLIS